MVAEYSGLREEIVKRIEVQHQILSMTLIAAAAFLGLGSQTTIPIPGAALLLYPFLAMFLAVAWAYNGIRVVDIARYLRTLEDNSDDGLGWERHMEKIEKLGSVRSVVAARGVFIITQLLAVALAIVRNNPAPIVMSLYQYGWTSAGLPEIAYAAFLAADALALIYTMLIIRQERRASRSKPETSSGNRSEPDTDGTLA